MVRAIFGTGPDASVYSGDTWEDVERKLRENGWNPADPVECRRELARRGQMWSGKAVRWTPGMSSRAFLKALAAAGAVRLA